MSPFCPKTGCYNIQLVELVVDHLFRHPAHLPRVAAWIYREFWQDKPGYSPATFETLLRQAADPGRIPLSLIALAGENPAGTVQFIQCDSESRPDLFPWLAALIVAPEFRRRGIGSLLVRCLLREAGRLGYDQLFLGTDIPGFYTRLGAVFFDQVADTLWVMRCLLDPRPGLRETRLPETFHV